MWGFTFFSLVCLLTAWVCFSEYAPTGGSVFVILACVLAWNAWDCTNPDVIARKAAEEVKEVARQREQEIPHVIREADGCKVYAFLSGERYHYFARCPDSRVTTESSYTVSCGKNCTRTEVESVQTVK